MKYYTYTIYEAFGDLEYISEVYEKEDGTIWTDNSMSWNRNINQWVRDEWMDSVFENWDHFKSSINNLRELNEEETEKFIYESIR